LHGNFPWRVEDPGCIQDTQGLLYWRKAAEL
jgi:hypothetical protein